MIFVFSYSLLIVCFTTFSKKRDGKLEYRRVTEEITSTYDEFGMRCERDAFDALLDHAPDKLQVVKKVITVSFLWSNIRPWPAVPFC